MAKIHSMADDIGTRIAKRRQALRWTQEELAARLGVAKSTVANWETGKHFPKRKLGAVEEVLGVDLGRESPETQIPPTIMASIDRTLPEGDPRREAVIDAIEQALRRQALGTGPMPAVAEPGRHRRRAAG